MSDTGSDETSPAIGNAQVATGQEAQKGRPKRGGSRRGGRPMSDGPEGGRQVRSRIDRGMTGFGDGIERAMCAGVPTVPPRTSPVQHRTGLAVRRLMTVDRTDSAVLLCDDSHDGPHVWPNGDVVGEDPLPHPPQPSEDDTAAE